jgi:glycosyltransferase involved in cell wall biosynthesis
MSALRLPVTVVIPVKNEERNLARCLGRLKRFAKIVVIDSGSTDRTREIAQEHGCEFVLFRWDGHFPKKRNWFLLNHPPTTPWVFFLDADEYLADEFVDELARALAMTTHAGFRVMYSNFFLGKKLKYGVPQIKLPIFRVGSGLYERIDEDEWSALDMEVHEHPVLEGTVGQLNTLVDHQDFKGLDAYIARHKEYASWEARRFLKLRETPEAMAHFTAIQRRKYDSLTSWWLAPSYFLYSWLWKRGILDGWAGFVFAKMKASYFSQIRRKVREFGAEKS